MSLYNEWNRNLCPFYISDDTRCIRCKSPVGMIAETVTEFEDPQKKEAHIQKYCESCEEHVHCPQHRINVWIWEEHLDGKFDYSRVTVAGRLTEDPELRQTATGTLTTTFSVAVNKPGKSEGKASFFKVVAWKNTAEFVTRYFRKGSSILVEGTLNQRTWIDGKGNDRSDVEIVADKAHFVDSKSEHTGAVPAEDDAPVYVPIDDDDMPF